MLIQKDLDLTSHGLTLKARLFFSDDTEKRPGVLFLAGARATSLANQNVITNGERSYQVKE